MSAVPTRIISRKYEAFLYVHRRVLQQLFGAQLKEHVAANLTPEGADVPEFVRVERTRAGALPDVSAHTVDTLFLSADSDLLDDLEEWCMQASPDRKFSEKMYERFTAILGQDVPYHDEFEGCYPPLLSQCPLAFVEEQLENQCRWWERDYPFFSAIEGGYRFLHDLLVEDRYRKVIEDSPGIARAIDWLDRHAKQDPRLLEPGLPPDRPEPPRVELLGLKPAALAELLRQCGVSTSSKPGKWAAAVAALRRLHLLEGSHSAVQQWLVSEFGASISYRTLSDKGDWNSVLVNREEKHVFEKATTMLKKYQQTP